MLYVLVLLIFVSNSVQILNAQSNRIVPKPLPEKVIVGYPDYLQCDDTLITAVKEGVNVLVWFSINLVRNQQTGKPEIQGGPDMNCVANTVKSIADLNLDVVHLISIGGWGSPHPDTSNSAEAMYNAFDYWNRNTSARPNLGFYGFDGFDWDIEGNNNVNSPYNTFTVDCLNLMGEMSVLGKSRGKYIVSMAPPESYLDPSTSEFDRSLLHDYPEWNFLQPPFKYHGRNCYGYLLSRYGNFSDSGTTVDTFDYIFYQLYESYSHADYQIAMKDDPPRDYFSALMQQFITGWSINFGSDPTLNWPTQSIKIPANKIVIGLANGWAGAAKGNICRCLLVYPDDLQDAYTFMKDQGIEPRGFGFWDIRDEGKISPQEPGIPVRLAAGINSFLHIRDTQK